MNGCCAYATSQDRPGTERTPLIARFEPKVTGSLHTPDSVYLALVGVGKDGMPMQVVTVTRKIARSGGVDLSLFVNDASGFTIASGRGRAGVGYGLDLTAYAFERAANAAGAWFSKRISSTSDVENAVRAIGLRLGYVRYCIVGA